MKTQSQVPLLINSKNCPTQPRTVVPMVFFFRSFVVPTSGSSDHDDDDVDGQQRCSVYIDDDDSADEVFNTSAGTIHVQFYARGDEDCVPAMGMANAPKKREKKNIKEKSITIEKDAACLVTGGLQNSTSTLVAALVRKTR